MFDLVAKVLLKYLTVKLKMFFGKTFWTENHLLLVEASASCQTDVTTSLWLYSPVIFSVFLCLVWANTSLVDWNESYLIFEPTLVIWKSSLMSSFGDSFRLFLTVTWHCSNLVEISRRLIPYCVVDNRSISIVPHGGISNQRRIWLWHKLSSVFFTQVTSRSAIVRSHEILLNK